MLAVTLSIGQSRSWRDESKTIGMCVKGGAPTTSLSGGLFSFTLPTVLPSNSTSGEATSFSGLSSFSDFDLLQNPFSFESENIFTADGEMIRRAGIRSSKADSVPTGKAASRARCYRADNNGLTDGTEVGKTYFTIVRNILNLSTASTA